MLNTILIVLVILLDQVSKYFAVEYVRGSGSIESIPGILSFNYHENPGAAWGILSNNRWVFMLISTLAILIIIVFFVYAHIKKIKIDPILSLSMCFFCGGGIGNMIDRVFLGYVVDFLQFDFIDFPIFNVADSFICIGAGLAVLYLLLDTIREYKTKHKKENGNVWLF
jgi:signal peptidase II